MSRNELDEVNARARQRHQRADLLQEGAQAAEPLETELMTHPNDMQPPPETPVQMDLLRRQWLDQNMSLNKTLQYSLLPRAANAHNGYFSSRLWGATPTLSTMSVANHANLGDESIGSITY